MQPPTSRPPWIARSVSTEFGRRHVRGVAIARLLVAIGMVTAGSIYCASGYWWGALWFVPAALNLWFANLMPGTYTVSKLTTPASYVDGKVTVGVGGGGQVSGEAITQVALQEFGNDYYYNFAEVKPAAISGFVYLDANSNGMLDAGETGIANVLLTLTGYNDQNVWVSLQTVTAGDGSYSFGNLRPGSYAVVKTPPTGYIDGAVNIGNLGGTTGTNTYWVTLSQADVGTMYNFGELLPGQPPPGGTTTPGGGGTPVSPPGGVPSKRDLIG